MPTSPPTELIFSHRAIRRLRPLLVDAGSFASGGMTVREAPPGVRELLVDDLQVTPDPPRGEARPPLDDYCVVAVDHAGGWQPPDLLRRIAPRASQLVAAVIFAGQPTGECRAVLGQAGVLQPVDGVRISGPGLPHLLPRETGPIESAAAGDVRWSRLAGVLGGERVSRLRQAVATVVGAGRLGSQLAFHLAAVGVCTLRLIDGDTLGLENLDAMPGLSADDVGRFKAEALAQRLCDFRPDLAVACVCRPLSDPAARALLAGRSDLLVTCVDNDTARLAASLAARSSLTVHLDVATSIQRPGDGPPQIRGDVRLLLPGEGCVSCVGGLDDPPRRLYDVAAPPGVLQRGRPQAWNDQRAGSLISINSLAAGTAVQAWLDLCCGRLAGSMWYRLAWRPETGLECQAGPVAAAEDCRFCGRAGAGS